MTQRRVAITGRGVVSPLGVGIEAHRKGLFAGVSAIRRSDRLFSCGFPFFWAGEVDRESLERHASVISPKQKKFLNRAGIFGAIASHLAVKESGLEGADLDPTRVGTFFATWFTFYDLRSFIRGVAGSVEGRQSMDERKANLLCMETMNPVDSLKVLPNLTAGNLAILHRTEGCSRVIADGWRGGLLAIAQGAESIRSGELDAVLAGGSEAPLEEGVFCELSVLDIMARDRVASGETCRPFDASRRGIVLGEGAGVVVLEEREHALARGAGIFGEILGSGSAAASLDGGGEEALSLSMKSALGEAGVAPEDLAFVHANGDSTLGNDRAEWRAIGSVFGPERSRIPVTATKSLHGHLLSASGAVELISSVLMLEEEKIASIAHLDRPDPACALDLVRGAPRSRPGMKFALLNAVGLFGEGASLVVRR